MTVALGFLMVLFLADNPMSSDLSRKEKIHVIERIRSNKTEIENKKFNGTQIIEALLDPNIWLIVVLMITATKINGALNNYQASIIKS
jgi:spermidine/putrescine-binding protein